MAKIVVKMDHKKNTPHTVVFYELSAALDIGDKIETACSTIYVNSKALEERAS